MSEVLQAVDDFFSRTSRVHEAARSISAELGALGIPFVIAGALAANVHGHRRTTQDVDLLLTREGLAEFKRHWLGRGYVEIFPGSKGMRDARNNVKIDVLLTGDHPGDGSPKPVRFPDPACLSATVQDGLPFLPLRWLVELKLASGMTAAHRMQDLADVMNLIRVNRLPRDYADGLNPFVGPKFQELWELAQVEDEY